MCVRCCSYTYMCMQIHSHSCLLVRIPMYPSTWSCTCACKCKCLCACPCIWIYNMCIIHLNEVLTYIAHASSWRLPWRTCVYGKHQPFYVLSAHSWFRSARRQSLTFEKLRKRAGLALQGSAAVHSATGMGLGVRRCSSRAGGLWFSCGEAVNPSTRLNLLTTHVKMLVGRV